MRKQIYEITNDYGETVMYCLATSKNNALSNIPNNLHGDHNAYPLTLKEIVDKLNREEY